MVKEELPQLNTAIIEMGENVVAVANLVFLVSSYYKALSLKELDMPTELVNELTRDFAGYLHQKAAGFQ